MSKGMILLLLIALYFVIKWAVKNGIRDYYEEQKEEIMEESEEEKEIEEKAKIEDFKLSRYACYLIVQNGNARITKSKLKKVIN